RTWSPPNDRASGPRRAIGSLAGTSSAGVSAAHSSPRPSGSVPPEALAFALAAAVLHAGWNVLLRGSEDVEARTAVVLGLSVLLFAPVAVETWSVSWAVAPYVAASAAFEGAYFALLVVAYRRQALSVVYPIARGSAPLLVLLGTAVVLSRHASAGARCSPPPPPSAPTRSCSRRSGSHPLPRSPQCARRASCSPRSWPRRSSASVWE